MAPTNLHKRESMLRQALSNITTVSLLHVLQYIYTMCIL